MLVALEVARPLRGQWQRLTITMSSTRKSEAEQGYKKYLFTHLFALSPHLNDSFSSVLMHQRQSDRCEFFNDVICLSNLFKCAECQSPIDATARLARGCLPSSLCSLTRVERERERECVKRTEEIPKSLSRSHFMAVSESDDDDGAAQTDRW